MMIPFRGLPTNYQDKYARKSVKASKKGLRIVSLRFSYTPLLGELAF